MSLDPQVKALVAKGVAVPVPQSVEVAADVDPDRISGDGVVIHAGCRIRGGRTVLSAGVELGREGPVTLEDCRLGPGVALKGGYAARSVFLARANLGLGHHVREGTLLEEEAGGAHCVGLKQTILFPFVTLGSLINFCDCLMAGGTSRSDHSEVGSSYIHFNFTPDGDKTTASIFGDVPRGVMLRERPIFLGGQGGAVGPLVVAYGTVVAAGSIVRSDLLKENALAVVGPPPTMNQDFVPGEYRNLNLLVAKNLGYLASLDALEAWYRTVRSAYFATEELGPLVYEGALEMLAVARQERLSRLSKLAAKVSGDGAGRVEFRERAAELAGIFGGPAPAPDDELGAALTAGASQGLTYLEAVRDLPADVVTRGTGWLRAIIDHRWAAVGDLLPAAARLRRG